MSDEKPGAEPNPGDRASPDSESWGEIKRLLDAALDKPHEEREKFLDRACPDQAVRREVQTMLAMEDEVGEFISEPIFHLLEEQDDPNLGRRIGAFRLVERLGHGGMGVVYLAERDDEELEQKVAIKLLKRGMDTDEIVRRFKSERQILANLDHPNIARLLDGGTTEEGLPFFIMEYVEGTPIDRYCDQRRLPVARRLELMTAVCDAVYYAHQNLVVHRDLKPANILVTDDGVPKLLDFGIAKLLSPDATGPVTVTAGAVRPLTLEYASPEQVRSAQITTASDTYSLGIVLFELLAGHRPFRAVDKTPAELELAICEQDPPRLSTAVLRTHRLAARGGEERTLTPQEIAASRDEEPRQLKRKLIGDLDRIVLKAMRKEPQGRYPSASQLGEDLRRFLDGRPVLARNQTVGYRLGKFVRRHKEWVAAAAIVLPMLLWGGATIWAQSQEVEREREKSDAVQEFVLATFESAEPDSTKGAELTARDMLDRFAEQLLEQEEIQQLPQARAEFLDRLGGVYHDFGDFEMAFQLREQALDLRLDFFDPGHPKVVASYSNTAQELRELGNVELAEERYEKARAAVLAEPERHRETAPALLHNYATFLDQLGRLQEAEELLLEVLDLKRTQFGELSAEFAVSLNYLAKVKAQQGFPQTAEQYARRALEIRQEVHEAPHSAIASSLQTLGHALYEQDRYLEAEEVYRRALTMRLKLYPEPHRDVASSAHSLGTALAGQGKLEESIRYIEMAVEIAALVLSPNEPNRLRYERHLVLVENAWKERRASGDPAATPTPD